MIGTSRPITQRNSPAKRTVSFAVMLPIPTKALSGITTKIECQLYLILSSRNLSRSMTGQDARFSPSMMVTVAQPVLISSEISCISSSSEMITSLRIRKKLSRMVSLSRNECSSLGHTNKVDPRKISSKEVVPAPL